MIQMLGDFIFLHAYFLLKSLNIDQCFCCADWHSIQSLFCPHLRQRVIPPWVDWGWKTRRKYSRNRTPMLLIPLMSCSHGNGMKEWSRGKESNDIFATSDSDSFVLKCLAVDFTQRHAEEFISRHFLNLFIAKTTYTHKFFL